MCGSSVQLQRLLTVMVGAPSGVGAGRHGEASPWRAFACDGAGMCVCVCVRLAAEVSRLVCLYD